MAAVPEGAWHGQSGVSAAILAEYVISGRNGACVALPRTNIGRLLTDGSCKPSK